MNAQAENPPFCFHTPEVRDLAWACFSPPLLHSAQLGHSDPLGSCGLPLTPTRREWLNALDRSPRPLQEHLASRRSTRLGIYFEAMWQFFLQQDREVDLLAHNLPVRDASRTLGEFDCIYYCHRRRRPVHLELAVKFYLQYPGAGRGNIDPERSWLGPNARDRLDLKLQRLLQHQILLSRKPEGEQALAAIGVRDPLLEIEVKGRLYHHVNGLPHLPAGYNRQLRLHHWCRAAEFPDLEIPGSEGYKMLPREQWLAPTAASSGEILHKTRAEEILAAGQWHQARQLAVIDRHGAELERLFIVANDWPFPHA